MFSERPHKRCFLTQNMLRAVQMSNVFWGQCPKGGAGARPGGVIGFALSTVPALLWLLGLLTERVPGAPTTSLPAAPNLEVFSAKTGLLLSTVKVFLPHAIVPGDRCFFRAVVSKHF